MSKAEQRQSNKMKWDLFYCISFGSTHYVPLFREKRHRDVCIEMHPQPIATITSIHTNEQFKTKQTSTISFHNIQYTLGKTKLNNCPAKKILRHVSGIFKPGMNAIMGREDDHYPLIFMSNINFRSDRMRKIISIGCFGSSKRYQWSWGWYFHRWFSNTGWVQIYGWLCCSRWYC